jgi:2-polyprenyl-3-methyl-5-hydroxy-6-metoxy-1,4-benzoquinol methylase
MSKFLSLALAPRRHQAELMDQPGLDPALHRQALAGLERVNWLSRSAEILWPEVRRLASVAPERKLRVLDIACGGGDVTIAIAARAAKAGLSITIEGCDNSPTAIDFASQNAARSRLGNVSFFPLDAIHDRWPDEYDVVMCSLFLHHLSDHNALALLSKMSSHARRLVLVNDLRRSRIGYVMAWVGCRLLSRSAIVHSDGPISVAAAFTCREARQLADKAGLKGATVTPRWPQRLLLRWSRP